MKLATAVWSHVHAAALSVLIQMVFLSLVSAGLTDFFFLLNVDKVQRKKTTFG